MRSLARECVYKYLFAKFFNTESEELFASLLKSEKLSIEDENFAKELKNSIEENFDKYLDIISDLSTGFKIDRVFIADKCALLIGIGELNSSINTPELVCIDEAVKLSAKYSAEKSTDFVNGVLAEYLRRKNG